MKSKLIQITDVQAERLTETLIDHNPISDLQEAVYRTAAEKGLMKSLLEAFVLTPDAGNMLRDGIRYMAFAAYAKNEPSYDAFATKVTSNRPYEEWLRDSVMGVLPRVKSGAPAPLLSSGFEGGAQIINNSYAGMVEITGDDIRFDRLGKIGQIAPELGLSARMTEESQVYADITTTGNYGRTQTAGDNDIGANTNPTTFDGLGVELAYTTISTMKDRRSGAYLGLKPNLLICGPRLEFAAKQLLMSADLQRQHGNTTVEVRGTGTNNVYRGLLTGILVSPWFGASYQWALVDTTRQSYIFQQVEAFNILQETMDASSESWLTRNVTRYRVQGYFGTGFIDDRPWYYSSSTTAPTVA